MSLLSAMRTQADTVAAPDTPSNVDRSFRHWRTRILATTIFGYAMYYFVRTNIGVPLKAMGG